MRIDQINSFMREALSEAKLASDKGEVPVGAVIVSDGEIIARAHNEVEQQKDATAHAEILAIRKASKVIDDWRLNELSLFVTLEPCSMCAGALILSRVSELYIGASDPRQGAIGSVFDISNHSELPHQIKVQKGLLEKQCAEILSRFFKEKRSMR